MYQIGQFFHSRDLTPPVRALYWEPYNFNWWRVQTSSRLVPSLKKTADILLQEPGRVDYHVWMSYEDVVPIISLNFIAGGISTYAYAQICNVPFSNEKLNVIL